MARFDIQFSSPLVSADVVHENCAVGIAGVAEIAPAPAANGHPPAQAPSPQKAPPTQSPISPTVQTVNAIKSGLQTAVAEISSQRNMLQSLAASYAVEVARVFLGSTDELIEQRLKQNVLHVLQHPDSIIVKLYVHSSCKAGIKRWLDENSDLQIPDLGVEVLPDDALQPGDCRVDFGRSGRLASLEQQLKLVESRLRESIRDTASGERG